MINLHNFTIIKERRTSGYFMPLKTSFMGYSPVFRINPFEINTAEADRYLYRVKEYLATYPGINVDSFNPHKYDFIEHCLASLFLSRGRRISSYSSGNGQSQQTSILDMETQKLVFQDRIENYYNDTELFSTYCNERVAYTTHRLGNMFFNNYNDDCVNLMDLVAIRYSFLYNSIAGYYNLQVGRGYVGILDTRTKKSTPLIVLVVKTEYIPYYRIANLLGMPIDYSMFELWVSDEIESLDHYYGNALMDFVGANIFNKLSKESSNIIIKLKSGMISYFDSIPTPKFNSISDRSEWLSSLKNEFINNTYNPSEKLPVKEFTIEPLTIKDSDKRLRSTRINKAIKLSQEFGIIQPTNQVELVE